VKSNLDNVFQPEEDEYYDIVGENGRILENKYEDDLQFEPVIKNERQGWEMESPEDGEEMKQNGVVTCIDFGSSI
jgi:hypothetical protein